jgi:sugar phosphate isomerase/epimerase
MYYDRRQFLKLSGMAVAGGLVVPRGAAAFYRQPHAIGLQLFTLFPAMDQDVPGNLKRVADIGYKEIESAYTMKGGEYGMKPKEFAALVRSMGMTWVSKHVLGAPFHMPANAKPMLDANGQPVKFPPMLNLTENMQELVDWAAEGGITYLVCANIPTKTSDEIKSSVDVLNKTNVACKKAGITLAYHNHTEEFTKVGEVTPYQVFLTQLSPDVVMELDLCWATKAGIDPVQLFRDHPGRFPLWHCKDLDKDRNGPAPVGEGVVDFSRIFASAQVAGMKHIFVEHDMPKDAFASITTSYNNLTKILST